MTGPGHSPLLSWQIDAPHQFAELGDLRLENGLAIEGFRQCYVTHGTLNADRSNAILVLSAINSTHHRLDFLIGPGRALDTSRWFIIAADAIGNGMSTSPSNSPVQPNACFPRFVVRDMVTAQYRLLTEHFGLKNLFAVVGASMGGMQALQWAVSHPFFVRNLVAMTPMARTSPWARMVNEAARACVQADPAWNGVGFTSAPVRGWRAWVAVQQVLAARTPQGIEDDFSNGDDAVQWLEDKRHSWIAGGYDAHDLIYQSWAYDAHDIGWTPGYGGDTQRALNDIRARTLILRPPLDLYNPVDQAKKVAETIPDAREVEIPSRQGHQAASALKMEDVDFLNHAIGNFLNEKP
jgi:homoserine O-acetyltransferase